MVAWNAAAGRFVLVTDAAPAAGMGDGSFVLGGRRIEAEDGVVRGPEGQLAGRARAGIDLKLGSGTWVQRDLPVVPAFADLLRESYGGAPEEADFAADPAAARAAINARIAERTGAKIPALLAPSDVSAGTQLLLTSAAYLGLPWRAPFDAGRTAPAPFTCASGERREVPTMQATGTFARAKGAISSSVLQQADGIGFQTAPERLLRCDSRP